MKYNITIFFLLFFCSFTILHIYSTDLFFDIDHQENKRTFGHHISDMHYLFNVCHYHTPINLTCLAVLLKTLRDNVKNFNSNTIIHLKTSEDQPQQMLLQDLFVNTQLPSQTVVFLKTSLPYAPSKIRQE